MESVTYSLFLVDIRNLVRNKLNICKNYNIQPSEIDRMPFYEYEFVLEDINADIKEQEKRQKEDEKKYGNISAPNYNQMMGNMSRNMPKINMPKL